MGISGVPFQGPIVLILDLIQGGSYMDPYRGPVPSAEVWALVLYLTYNGATGVCNVIP